MVINEALELDPEESSSPLLDYMRTAGFENFFSLLNLTTTALPNDDSVGVMLESDKANQKVRVILYFDISDRIPFAREDMFSAWADPKTVYSIIQRTFKGIAGDGNLQRFFAEAGFDAAR